MWFEKFKLNLFESETWQQQQKTKNKIIYNYISHDLSWPFIINNNINKQNKNHLA